MQRYKVFINEHSILFVESTNLKAINGNVLYLKTPSAAEVFVCVESFMNEESPIQVVVESNALEDLWTDFCQMFQWIEAAGGIVRNKKDELLIIKRLDKWDLPKGKIESGEDPQTAALREVQEECGLTKLTLGNEIDSTYHIYPMKGELVLKRTFWFEMGSNIEDQLKPQVEENIELVEWVNQKEFKHRMLSSYKSLFDLIKAYFDR